MVVVIVVVVGRVWVWARAGVDDDEVLPALFPVLVPGGGGVSVMVMMMMQCESWSSSPPLSSLRRDFDEDGWW